MSQCVCTYSSAGHNNKPSILSNCTVHFPCFASFINAAVTYKRFLSIHQSRNKHHFIKMHNDPSLKFSVNLFYLDTLCFQKFSLCPWLQRGKKYINLNASVVGCHVIDLGIEKKCKQSQCTHIDISSN